MGFEPTRAFTLPVFKTGAFNRSATSPLSNRTERLSLTRARHQTPNEGRLGRVPERSARPEAIAHQTVDALMATER